VLGLYQPLPDGGARLNGRLDIGALFAQARPHSPAVEGRVSASNFYPERVDRVSIRGMRPGPGRSRSAEVGARGRSSPHPGSKYPHPAFRALDVVVSATSCYGLRCCCFCFTI